MSGRKESTKCANCNKEVKKNDNGVQCDKCGGWYHAGCHGVSLGFYRALQENKDQQWFCKPCRQEMKQMEDRIKQLTKEKEELKEKLKEFEHKWETFKEDLKQDTVTSTVEIVMERMSDHLKEIEERNNRRKNLVIYNIPESESQNPQDRKTDDLVKCCDIFEASLKVTEYEIENTVRLGKKESNRKRPLLVKMMRESDKINILKNAKNLKDETEPWKKRLGITRDMTKMEREREGELRRELKQKKDQGEQGWMIRNGKLVQDKEGNRRTTSVGS